MVDISILVGGWTLPLWKTWVKVSWDEIPNMYIYIYMESHKKCSKPPTSLKYYDILQNKPEMLTVWWIPGKNSMKFVSALRSDPKSQKLRRWLPSQKFPANRKLNRWIWVFGNPPRKKKGFSKCWKPGNSVENIDITSISAAKLDHN